MLSQGLQAVSSAQDTPSGIHTQGKETKLGAQRVLKGRLEPGAGGALVQRDPSEAWSAEPAHRNQALDYARCTSCQV